MLNSQFWWEMLFFLYNNIYNGISHITVDHPWSAPLSLSSMGIAAQMSGIAPIKLLLNKSNELNCMVEENNNESIVKLLNLYEWVAGLTKSGQNSCSGPRPWESNNLHRSPTALAAWRDWSAGNTLPLIQGHNIIFIWLYNLITFTINDIIESCSL